MPVQSILCIPHAGQRAFCHNTLNGYLLIYMHVIKISGLSICTTLRNVPSDPGYRKNMEKTSRRISESDSPDLQHPLVSTSLDHTEVPLPVDAAQSKNPSKLANFLKIPSVCNTTTQRVGHARVLTSLDHIKMMEEREQKKKEEAQKKEQRKEERLRKKVLAEERKKDLLQKQASRKKGIYILAPDT